NVICRMFRRKLRSLAGSTSGGAAFVSGCCGFSEPALECSFMAPMKAHVTSIAERLKRWKFDIVDRVRIIVLQLTE
ncbi:MAG: hypothetical protein ACK58T_18705, partial [Phycisphaerae bacterium]